MDKITEIKAFKCGNCQKIYETKEMAEWCADYHIREDDICEMWEGGCCLGDIEEKYHLWHKLADVHTGITKDNCFKISYLQCCDYPAYQVHFISAGGEIRVSGEGGWSGYYASKVDLHSLDNPRPEEELWKYSEYRKAFNSV